MAKKQILSLVVASLLAATFVGCGSSNDSTPAAAAQPFDVTVSDAYVYNAEVTKGGLGYSTADGAVYTWTDAAPGNFASVGGANDIDGIVGASAGDTTAISMSANGDYSNINPFTTLETGGMTLNDINSKYGIDLNTTDIDVVKADLSVYKAAAKAALEIASGNQITPPAPTPDDNGTTPDVNGTMDPEIAPSRPAIEFRAIAPSRPGEEPAVDENGTVIPPVDTNTTVDLTAEFEAIDAATDIAGVNAAIKPKMIQFKGLYEMPTTPDVNGTIPDVNGTIPDVNGTGTECLPGQDCTPDENGTTPDVNGTTSGEQIAPDRP